MLSIEAFRARIIVVDKLIDRFAEIFQETFLIYRSLIWLVDRLNDRIYSRPTDVLLILYGHYPTVPLN